MEISKVLRQAQERAEAVLARAREEIQIGDPKRDYAKRQERVLNRMSKNG